MGYLLYYSHAIPDKMIGLCFLTLLKITKIFGYRYSKATPLNGYNIQVKVVMDKFAGVFICYFTIWQNTPRPLINNEITGLADGIVSARLCADMALTAGKYNFARRCNDRKYFWQAALKAREICVRSQPGPDSLKARVQYLDSLSQFLKGGSLGWILKVSVSKEAV